MTAYLITYDLNSPGQNYNQLYEDIKSLGAWAHYLDSTWFVNSSKTPSQIVDLLRTNMDSNDSLFVSEITLNYQGLLTDKQWQFLKENILPKSKQY